MLCRHRITTKGVILDRGFSGIMLSLRKSHVLSNNIGMRIVPILVGQSGSLRYKRKIVFRSYPGQVRRYMYPLFVCLDSGN